MAAVVSSLVASVMSWLRDSISFALSWLGFDLDKSCITTKWIFAVLPDLLSLVSCTCATHVFTTFISVFKS